MDLDTLTVIINAVLVLANLGFGAWLIWNENRR